jgi:hypothetical protein
MLLAVAFGTSIVGFYGGGMFFGFAIGELTTTNQSKVFWQLAGTALALEMIPLGWLSYALLQQYNWI